MVPINHLDETIMEELRPGQWIPAIPLPLFTHRSIFKQSYQCGCGEAFKSMAEYREHYRTEQMLEMNAKMARTRDLGKAKALFWRRYAYVVEFGNDDDRDSLAELDGPEMHTLSEMESLNRELEGVWGQVYLRHNKEANTNVGRMKDETEITDEDPAAAAKDLDDIAYSHTNSKGVTYFLHETTVTLRGGKEQTIYFFRRAIETNHPKYKPALLPEGYSVRENPRNGFLTVSRGDRSEAGHVG